MYLIFFIHLYTPLRLTETRELHTYYIDYSIGKNYVYLFPILS